jgi:hypothetical protein
MAHVHDPYSSVSLIRVALLLLGTSPGVLCKRRRNLYFAGGLCQAKPRTNEGNGLVVYWTLASRLLISIRIPLVITKAETPRSQDPDPSVVRDRCHANFLELRHDEVDGISAVTVDEGVANDGRACLLEAHYGRRVDQPYALHLLCDAGVDLRVVEGLASR